MAKNKTVVTPQTDNLGNGPDSTNTNTPAVDSVKVDIAKDTNKLLVNKMKSVGIDAKGLYTEYDNPSTQSDAIDMIDFMVMKHKLTTDDKAAILAMLNAMQVANAPKVRTVKVIPEGLAEDFAQAWYTRQAVLTAYNAAKTEVDKFWCASLDASKTELDAARAAVHTAGYGTDLKTGHVKTTGKAGTTDGNHGNAGTSRVQTGCTITVGTVSYNGWKDLAKNLVTSVYKPDTSTNYPVNTAILAELVKMELPVTVHITPTLVNGTKDAALEAWHKSALFAKLGEYSSITVEVK